MDFNEILDIFKDKKRPDIKVYNYVAVEAIITS